MIFCDFTKQLVEKYVFFCCFLLVKENNSHLVKGKK